MNYAFIELDSPTQFDDSIQMCDWIQWWSSSQRGAERSEAPEEAAGSLVAKLDWIVNRQIELGRQIELKRRLVI